MSYSALWNNLLAWFYQFHNSVKSGRSEKFWSESWENGNYYLFHALQGFWSCLTYVTAFEPHNPLNLIGKLLFLFSSSEAQRVVIIQGHTLRSGKDLYAGSPDLEPHAPSLTYRPSSRETILKLTCLGVLFLKRT